MDDFKIISVVEDGVLQPRASWAFEEIQRLSKEDSLRENFTRKRFLLERHLVYSALTTAEGEFVTACGLFNGGRYPEGVYRCMNRTFVNPKFRVHHGRYPALATRYLLPYQIAKYEDRINTLFVSRENPKARRFLKRWIALVADYGKWELCPDMVQVVPGRMSPRAYQAAAILYLKGEPWAPARISDLEWRGLEEVRA